MQGLVTEWSSKEMQRNGKALWSDARELNCTATESLAKKRNGLEVHDTDLKGVIKSYLLLLVGLLLGLTWLLLWLS